MDNNSCREIISTSQQNSSSEKLEFDDDDNNNDDDNNIESLVSNIEKITSHRFKNSRVLKQAFADCPENRKAFKRLAFLGDAVLNYIVAEEIFFKYEDLNEGQLTALRAANVNSVKLGLVALKYNFHDLLLDQDKAPQFSRQIEEFKEAILESPLDSFAMIKAPTVLKDIITAFIGALDIDCYAWSSDTTKRIVKELLQPMVTPENLEIHPKTKLYELCQKKGWKIDFVDQNWKENGEVEVFIEDKFAGKGKSISKKSIAFNRAAKDALNQISTNLELIDCNTLI